MIAGIDEAGRGPVIGPMVVCGVLFHSSDLERLHRLEVRDSKTMSAQRRQQLAPRILALAHKHEIVEIEPRTIDRAREKNQLNELEARVFAQIIQKLRPSEAFIDSADANPEKFKQRLQRYLRSPVHLIVENFADQRYVQVAAASIVAKVVRDSRIAELRSVYGDFGSGYPADPKTKKFLREWLHKHGSFPDFVRKSWKTLQHL